ncbi:Uma2 family endonuclease [Streptomyces apocyni]|uniref:Uma2 family endonuclease n=1 Tax=Streptomyces apocyni TaxID=2654677 RepID=UPI0012EA906F|nr:Uma2 family endonuclease [Streptomyces apocyni]
MSAQPHSYDGVDPEHALKYAVQHMPEGTRVQLVEGQFEIMTPTWAHENAADLIREQIGPRMRELGMRAGSGNLDLPGTPNYYVPDLAVVPSEAAKTEGALLPSDTELIVEVTSPSNGETDRIVKRRRYAQYSAPLYLLVDRQDGTCTLFSEPGQLGYTTAQGPYPFGTPVHLPSPFNVDLDTTGF